MGDQPAVSGEQRGQRRRQREILQQSAFCVRIPHGVWRRLHMLNFAVWILALAHGITAGTDSDTSWAITVYLLASGSVAGACVWRLLRVYRAPAWAIAIWTGTASIVAAELVLALAVGPLARP